MTQLELNGIAESHANWLNGKPDGQRADLTGADLGGMDLSGFNLSRAVFKEADLSRAQLAETRLYKADLTNANLSNADLVGANLLHADLSAADVTGADLYGANLQITNLSLANFGNANIGGADLSGANLHNASLNRADLRGAKLNGVNALQANFTDADLRYAQAPHSNLREAVFMNADLHKADLSHANLREADLRNANLTGAGLSETEMNGADLRGTIGGADPAIPTQPNKTAERRYEHLKGLQDNLNEKLTAEIKEAGRDGAEFTPSQMREVTCRALDKAGIDVPAEVGESRKDGNSRILFIETYAKGNMDKDTVFFDLTDSGSKFLVGSVHEYESYRQSEEFDKTFDDGIELVDSSKYKLDYQQEREEMEREGAKKFEAGQVSGTDLNGIPNTDTVIDVFSQAREAAKQALGNAAIVTSAQTGKTYQGEIICVIDNATDKKALMAISENRAVLHDIKDADTQAAVHVGKETTLTVNGEGYSAAQNQNVETNKREGLKR